MDLVSECDWPSQMQQRDITVEIFLPVVLWVNDDLVNRHDLLNVAFIPDKQTEASAVVSGVVP